MIMVIKLLTSLQSLKVTMSGYCYCAILTTSHLVCVCKLPSNVPHDQLTADFFELFFI